MKTLLSLLLVAGINFGSYAQSTQSTVKASSKTSVHLKADGTPDKRYKENKTSFSTTVTGPTKKDGTPDMRYKSNESSKTVVSKKSSSKM